MRTGVFVILLVNMCGNIPSIFLHRKFGRRSMLLSTMIALTVLLFIMSFSAFYKMPYLLLVSTAIFMMMCQFAPLPVGWMYMHEVSNYKGVTVGMGINLILRIIIGLVTGPMYKSESIGPGGSFMIFGFINFIAMILIFLFVKETKGLSEI